MRSKGSLAINKIKKEIIPVLKSNKVTKAGIFGSFARGEQNKNSDVDILIEIDKEVNLLGLIRLKLKIEELLKRKVDLVEYTQINPLIKDEVIKEEVRIL